MLTLRDFVWYISQIHDIVIKAFQRLFVQFCNAATPCVHAFFETELDHFLSRVLLLEQ